jgi:hypothetical protein
MGYGEQALSEVVARGNMQEDANHATRIADIVLPYLRAVAIGVHNYYGLILVRVQGGFIKVCTWGESWCGYKEDKVHCRTRIR